MTLKSTSEADSSSGRHGGAFPSSASVALAITVVAAAAETAAWCSEWNLANNVLHVSSFPSGRALPGGCELLILPSDNVCSMMSFNFGHS